MDFKLGTLYIISVAPSLFSSRDGFMEYNFFLKWGGLDGFRMIQANCIYCALYYYYISSTSGHQALDLGGWGHLRYVENLKKCRILESSCRDSDLTGLHCNINFFLKVPQVIVMWIQEWELLVEQIAFRVSKKWDPFSRAVISKRDLASRPNT